MTTEERQQKRRSSADPRWVDSMTTALPDTRARERRNHIRHSAPETMTMPKKRRDDFVVPDDETMTTCACGTEFMPARKKQLHCSTQCRQKAYEQTDKARIRRTRYWKTQKGLDTRQRYVKTGASAESSRTWREHQTEYRKQFLKWVRNNPDASMEHIFGEGKDRIPLDRSYRVYVSLKSAGYLRESPFVDRLMKYLKQAGTLWCSNAEHSRMLEQGKTHCDQCQIGEIHS